MAVQMQTKSNICFPVALAIFFFFARHEKHFFIDLCECNGFNRRKALGDISNQWVHSNVPVGTFSGYTQILAITGGVGKKGV